MLKVFFAHWCPHCTKTMEFLKAKSIPFMAVDIEKSSEDVVELVIDANGGDDWVVPTLEFDGKWIEGKVFEEKEVEISLKKLGVTI